MELDKSIELSKISAEERSLVEKQLKLILESPYFNSAKQMQRFLEYIVEKSLDGKSTHLKQYTIGVEALEFTDDFDSETNPVVRIMGGRVRKRLEDFYESTNNNVIRINIPKGSYIPEFIYLNIEENIESEKNEELNQEIYTSVGPKLALLSFSDQNQSKKSNQLLTQTTDLLVENLSSFLLFNLVIFNPYSDKEQSHGIGYEIDADYVLALFLQEFSDGKYRLVWRLSKTGSKDLLLSDSHEINEESEHFNQNEIIARMIATVADIHQGRLHTHWSRTLLLDKENIPYTYKALAMHGQYYDNLSKQSLIEAILFYEEAVSKNPNDVIASILYSDICRRDYSYSYDLIESSLQKGISLAERVVHLRQDSHEAHFVLGQLLFNLGEWDRSRDELLKSKNLTSSYASVGLGVGFYFCMMDDWEEGIKYVQKAISTSGAHPSWYYLSIFLHLFFQEKYEESMIEAKKIIAPNLPHGPLSRCLGYIQLGEMKKAKLEYSELLLRMPILENNHFSIFLRLFGNKKIVNKICNVLKKLD